MPQISLFMLCDAISNTSGSKEGLQIPQLNSPQLVLRPQYIPSNYSFGLSVGIQGLDMSVSNKIEVKIIEPNGKTIATFGNTMNPMPDDTLPVEYQGVVISIDIRNMPIDFEGIYHLCVSVNDKDIGEKVIPIFKRGQLQ